MFGSGVWGVGSRGLAFRGIRVWDRIYSLTKVYCALWVHKYLAFCAWVLGSGFRVYGLSCSPCCYGPRLAVLGGLGFRVLILGFSVEGVGSRTWALG